MAHDVFICYSSKDKTTADAVCAVLESEGIRCWIAPRDILAGMSYGEAIVDAIHKAKALVLVFSGHANSSPQIEREVERAINKRIPVIPLRIEDVAPDKALEYFLSTPHWLDAFTPPLERHLRNLAGQIHRLIGTTKPAEAPSPSAGSPFKTVLPDPTPSTEPRSAEPATAAFLGATAAAGTAGTASATSSSAGSVPRSATATTSAKPAASPVDWFKKLDTPQKVGIGAGALALVIGVGWMLASSGSQPAPSPLASIPNVNISPEGGVTVNDGSRTVRVGPDGVRVGDTQAPSGQLPSDGNVVPGREMPAGGGDAPGMVDGVYNTVSAADVAGVLAQAGHQANVGSNSAGNPLIDATVQGENNSFRYQIAFYRCNAQSPKQCLDLQFHTSFSNDRNVGDEQINAYNRDNRFGQAYFMPNGEIGLDMSATLQGGVSREHIKEVVAWWKVTVTSFPRKIGGG